MSHPLRQSLPSQESHRPFGTAEKPRKRGLLQTKLMTAASARNAVFVSLSPVVSKAPDFAILVRNFKRLILNGYSAQEIRTFRIPLVTRGALRSKSGAEIAVALGVYGTALSRRLKPLVAQRQPITVRLILGPVGKMDCAAVQPLQSLEHRAVVLHKQSV